MKREPFFARSLTLETARKRLLRRLMLKRKISWPPTQAFLWGDETQSPLKTLAWEAKDIQTEVD